MVRGDPASDFLRRERFQATPGELVVLDRGGADNPKHHRADGPKRAAQKNGLHPANPSKIGVQISVRTFRNR
jgi:hypothetical protein